jgi:hypothetical protein
MAVTKIKRGSKVFTEVDFGKGSLSIFVFLEDGSNTENYLVLADLRDVPTKMAATHICSEELPQGSVWLNFNTIASVEILETQLRALKRSMIQKLEV